MNGLLISDILLHGLILSIGISVIILGGTALNPRIVLNDYPPEIQALVPPITQAEKRGQALMTICVLGFLLLVAIYSNVQVVTRSGEALFLPLLVNSYLVFEIFNLFDLIVLDYFILLVLRPKFLFIEGVDSLAQYQPFAFHLKGFFKGLGIGFVLSLVIAAVCTILL